MGGAWGTREPLTATHLPFHGTQVHGSGFFPLALLGASPARAGASRGRAPTLFDRPWPPHRPKRVPNRKYATCPEVCVGGPRFPVSGKDHCFHRRGEDTTKPPSDRRRHAPRGCRGPVSS